MGFILFFFSLYYFIFFFLTEVFIFFLPHSFGKIGALGDKTDDLRCYRPLESPMLGCI